MRTRRQCRETGILPSPREAPPRRAPESCRFDGQVPARRDRRDAGPSRSSDANWVVPAAHRDLPTNERPVFQGAPAGWPNCLRPAIGDPDCNPRHLPRTQDRLPPPADGEARWISARGRGEGRGIVDRVACGAFLPRANATYPGARGMHADATSQRVSSAATSRRKVRPGKQVPRAGERDEVIDECRASAASASGTPPPGA